MALYTPEIFTPMTFDLEIMMLQVQIKDIFGAEVLKKEDIKDLFRDFSNDPMHFVQLWDTINYQVMENALVLDD